MRRRLLLLFFLTSSINLVLAQDIDSQNYRTYDGSHNNQDNVDWGAAGVNLLRVTEVGYADGISEMGGANRPNPRTVSNDLFAQDGLLNDPLSLSDYCWVWGQFLDHDIGLTTDAQDESAMIFVPAGDPWFDPLGMGTAVIPMSRSTSDPATGTGIDNPRQHPNQITTFIDGSNVYGSDEAHANWLRTFSGGKLKTSAGNLLPFNTMTGELDAEIDPTAPHMDNATGISDKVFVAGDVRANENVLLLSMHTLFVREHNRLCDELIEEYPDWTDEQLYQHARKIVGALIQNVVYSEWLPAMGVDIDAYSGYKSDVNPGLFNVFTAAAFRLGHTLLNSQIRRLDDQGDSFPGELGLRDAFFNPMVLVNTGGIEPFLKGMGEQVQQDMDHKVIDDVRNFLFGPPGAGGLDLASININRGRERGLPHFNSVRQTFGLEPYNFYGEINSDASVFIPLLTLYSSVDDIDPWVGMLAEAHMHGTLFGPTVMKIMEVQFTRLRDGDRFYFLNDPVLSPTEKDKILATTLHDIIMRNTGIILMQDNVFDAMPHEDICGSMTSDVAGQVYTEEGQAVADVTLDFTIAGATEFAFTDSEGNYDLTEVESCGFESLNIFKEDDYANGVSTLDMVFIQQHILGVEALSSPYKLIAADVNNTGSLSTLDLIELRKLILTIQSEFPNVPSWRFLPADYDFVNAEDPWDEIEQEYMNFEILPSEFEQNFIAVKMGDVNGSAETGASFNGPLEDRGAPVASHFYTNDMLMEAGNTYDIHFTGVDMKDLAGFQFSLEYDANKVQYKGLSEEGQAVLTATNFAHFDAEGLLTCAWNKETEQASEFSLTFTAKENVRLSEVLQLNSKRTKAEAYNENYQVNTLDLMFSTLEETAGFELFQNQPNPFSVQTTIPFQLYEAGGATLTIFDVSGKVLFRERKSFEEGYNEWIISGENLAANGLIYYRLDTDNGTATRKMVLSR